MGRARVALATVVLLVAQGCSASHRSADQPTSPSSASTSAGPSRTPATEQPAEHAGLPTKVLVVIEENHSFDQMRAGMPFLASVSERYGYATQWKAITHPSEPNYLAITGGSTFGVTDDEPPSRNASKVGSSPSVFSQAMAAGKTAATYAESMGTPCALVGSYPYAVRHNPWTYYSSERTACSTYDRDASAFSAAARSNALPNVGFLIPDVLHDAHDGSLDAADTWLRSQLTPVLASDDFTSGKLVVVVTADEDDHHSDNRVLTSVLSPGLDHQVVGVPLTHYSLTRFIDEVLGVTPLGQAAAAPDMRDAFGL